MDVEHADLDLADLEASKERDGAYPKGVARKFRWVMQQIRAASRKTQLYQIRSFRLKKLERPGEDERMWIIL